MSILERGLIKKNKDDNFYTVMKDIPYNSVSLPATVVTGRPSNGRIEWKTADGKTLAEIEQ